MERELPAGGDEVPLNQDSYRTRSRSERNGSIELLRFLFALSIVGIHLEGISDFRWMHNGHYGVEFFFLVSGLFLAQSAQRYLAGTHDIADSTRGFVLKKICQFMPYVLVACFISLVLYSIPCYLRGDANLIVDLVDSVPAILMLAMSGMCTGTTVVDNSMWYLSAMTIGMLILFPLYLRYNKIARMVFFPLIGIFSIGYLQLNYGYITLTWESSGSFYYGMVRAIGEMSLGIVCYDLGCHLRSLPFTRFGKVLISTVLVLSLVAVALFIYGHVYYSHSTSILVLMAIILVILYSGVLWNVPCGRVVALLGAVSLTLYVIHPVVLRVSIMYLGDSATVNSGIPLLIASVLSAFALYYLVDFLMGRKESIKGALIRESDRE